MSRTNRYCSIKKGSRCTRANADLMAVLWPSIERNACNEKWGHHPPHPVPDHSADLILTFTSAITLSRNPGGSFHFLPTTMTSLLPSRVAKM